MASSSSVSVFDNYRFRTAFNEELYNTTGKNKKVISEVCFNLKDDEYPEIREQIALRGWRRLAAPTIEIMNFSPENIRRVMRFKAEVEGARTDFETRKAHDLQLDNVLSDLCMPGATWKLSTGQQKVPIQLRRQELNPLARGWHELSIHSHIPSSNRSEILVIRAILIHCIMKGEDVRAKEIITNKIIRIAQGIKEKGKLGFPSIIYKLCKDAGPQDNEDEDQPMPQAEEGHEEEQGEEHDYQHHQPEYDHQPEFQHEPQFQQPPLYEILTYTDQHEMDLHSIEEQLQNMMWLQQQCLENINKSQVEYMAELRTIKGMQQEMFKNNDRFYNQVREEQREMAKEIQQVKNYQVNQTMIESARNKALMEELAAVKTRQEEFFSNQTNQYNMIRKEQNLLGKEILDVKKHQMNTVTMGSSSSPNKYEPDQALIKIREQHANFSKVQRQLKEWTKNSCARECYSVWAHQQENPNLVEMAVHKTTKEIYDNSNNNRPLFYGLLKSDLPPSGTAPPPPKSKDPRDAPN
ncbi:hypothetical protein PIB30_090962 [Stylosanthes scabra]|uniref:Putative plant transposon protein domain-containing protein n=1 Tax=Stylosanthes scabra TaxID=79078 RepID=A0ABU6QWU1_9FABA|nr:hypothetical protein [Stylosanthes scabra]